MSSCWESLCWVSLCGVPPSWVPRFMYCNDEWSYAECHYAECHYAECRCASAVALSPFLATRLSHKNGATTLSLTTTTIISLSKMKASVTTLGMFTVIKEKLRIGKKTLQNNNQQNVTRYYGAKQSDAQQNGTQNYSTQHKNKIVSHPACKQ